MSIDIDAFQKEVTSRIAKMVDTIEHYENPYQRNRFLMKVLPKELDRISTMLDAIAKGIPIHTRRKGKKVPCGLCLEEKDKHDVVTILKGRDGSFRLVSLRYNNLNYRDPYWVCPSCWEKFKNG